MVERNSFGGPQREISPLGRFKSPVRTTQRDRSHDHDQTASPSEKSSPPQHLLTLVERNIADSVDVTPGMTSKKQAELVAQRLRAEDAKTAMVRS